SVAQCIFGGAADSRPEIIMQSEGNESIVGGSSYSETDEEWRNFRNHFSRVPHHRKGKRGKEDAERLDRAGVGQYEGEWLGLLETAYVGQLYEEQERRGRRLETCHDRVRCEFE